MCVCPNHEYGSERIERLFLKSELQHHLRGPEEKASFGSGHKWSSAHKFIEELSETLNPSSDSFKPITMDIRTKPFDHYKHPTIHAKAMSLFAVITNKLAATTPGDSGQEACSWWFLHLYFDAIIFSGDKKMYSSSPKDVSRAVSSRLKKLVDGEIEDLWTSAFPPPSTKTTRKGDDDERRNRRIMQLAKLNRFSDATSAATSNLVGTEMDSAGVLQFERAVNPSVIVDDDVPDITRRRNRERTQIDPTLFTHNADDDVDENGVPKQDPGLLKLKEAILSTPKGKAVGFAGDSMDFWRHVAETSGKNGEGLQSSLEVIRRVLRGQMPLAIRPMYNLIVGCLFVKPDTNPVAYRPIGIPTAFYRIVGKFFCREVGEEMAALLLEVDQYAIGVPAGMSILIGSLQLLVQKFINLDDESDGPAAMRALLSLDLTSMFNALNLDTFFDECDKEKTLKKYLPYFETCFFEITTYVIQKSDGSVVHVTQEQGGAQGSNLLPLMAATLMRRLIKEFQNEKQPTHLTPHTEESIANIVIEQNNSNGGQRDTDEIKVDEDAVESFKAQRESFVNGSGAPIFAYMDDMSGVASYSYLISFSRFLVEKGPKVGAYVNWSKTQLLLGNRWDKAWRDQTSGGTIRTFVNIKDAFRELGVPEQNIITCAEDGPTTLAKVKGGIKLLGSLIGFSAGIIAFRRKVLAKQIEAFGAIMKHVQDKNVRSILVRMCILPKTNHMFATAPNRIDIETFAGECDDAHRSFFEQLYMEGKSLDSDTDESYRLATLLIRQGGINFTSPKNSYMAAFLATWARVFAAASRPPEPIEQDPDSQHLGDKRAAIGFLSRDGNKIGTPHPAVQAIIDHEMSLSSLPCVNDFNGVATELCTAHKETIGIGLAQSKGPQGIIAIGAIPMLQHSIAAAIMADATQDIYNGLCNRESSSGVQSHLRQIMPSSAQPLGSAFLENLRMSQGRVSSEGHHVGVKLKLGIPIFNIPQGVREKCKLCGKMSALDRYGTHVLTCSKTWVARTAAMHNPFRNSFALMLKQLQAIGSEKAQFGNVKLEVPGLVPGSASRPADVCFSLMGVSEVLDKSGNKMEDITQVAVDITFTQLLPSAPIPGVKNEAVWFPETYKHLTNAEKVKREYTHSGATPGGTATFLAQRGTAFLPIAVDAYGGMGTSAAAFLYGSAAATKMKNQKSVLTTAHYEDAGWIREKDKQSGKTSDYYVPYFPKDLHGQLRAASMKAKEDIANSGGKANSKNYWESPGERKMMQLLSSTLVEGTSAVVMFYKTAITSAGGENAVANADFARVREKLFLSAEKMMEKEAGRSNRSAEEMEPSNMNEQVKSMAGEEQIIASARHQGEGGFEPGESNEDTDGSGRNDGSTTGDSVEDDDGDDDDDDDDDNDGDNNDDDDHDDDDDDDDDDRGDSRQSGPRRAAEPNDAAATQTDEMEIDISEQLLITGETTSGSSETTAGQENARYQQTPKGATKEEPERHTGHAREGVQGQTLQVGGVGGNGAPPPTATEGACAKSDDQFVVDCFSGEIKRGAERSALYNSGDEDVDPTCGHFFETDIKNNSVGGNGAHADVTHSLLSEAEQRESEARHRAMREDVEMSSDMRRLSLGQQQNDQESRGGQGGAITQKREHRSLSGGGPESLKLNTKNSDGKN